MMNIMRTPVFCLRTKLALEINNTHDGPVRLSYVTPRAYLYLYAFYICIYAHVLCGIYIIWSAVVAAIIKRFLPVADDDCYRCFIIDTCHSHYYTFRDAVELV